MKNCKHPMENRVNFHATGYRCQACETDVDHYPASNTPKVVYIIGRTTNMPQLNLKDFNTVEGFLHKYGYETVKQHDLFQDNDHHVLTQQEAMQRRFDAMDQCDMVVLIPNWMECSYARREQRYARTMQMDVRDYTTFCASHRLCKSTPKASVEDLRKLLKTTAA